MKSSTDNSVSAANEYTCGAVIVCAGKGERTGLNYNKVLYNLGHKSVLETVLDVFAQSHVNNITVVAAQTDLDRIRSITQSYNNVSVCIGGNTRSESVYNGLKHCPCDIVVIHDGARPFVTADLIDKSIDSAVLYGSGIAAVRSVDSVKYSDDDDKIKSIPRARIFNAQTPQTFKYAEILHAYDMLLETDIAVCTDDAEIYEYAGYVPHLIEGSYDNIKITNAKDLFKTVPDKIRIGSGFDVHCLVVGRPLILGGINIPYELGLEGHSDADVLIHAVMDALLSAADCPDIGVLFPDTDPKYLGISSVKLLKEVNELIKSKGFAVNNISAVIIAQAPKLAPIIQEIRKNISVAIAIDQSLINISATTTERLGIVGEGKAIAASATCLLTEIYD